MATSWEIQQSNSVLCAILSVETTTISWAFGFRQLIIPGQVAALQGMPYDHARNQACWRVIQSDFQYVFFLDSDVVPPPDAILRLMNHRKPIISGLYRRRSHPVGKPVMQRPLGNWVEDYVPGSVIEVDVVGAGCLLIHRSVLEQFLQAGNYRPGKPWFDWRVDLQGHLPQGECLSEDFAFCMDAKKKFGIPTLVDTGVDCRHIGNSEVRTGYYGPSN